jgi:hypothetical protein
MCQDSSLFTNLWKLQDNTESAVESATEANPNSDDNNIEAINNNNSSGLLDPPLILLFSSLVKGTMVNLMDRISITPQ